eukprot:scaffold12036_cov61-Phaeocystis_antarctica.AAC.3
MLPDSPGGARLMMSSTPAANIVSSRASSDTSGTGTGGCGCCLKPNMSGARVRVAARARFVSLLLPP